MELYVTYLLLLLNDFAVGENAASAIRDQKYREPGVLINKLMPQKVYVVPNVVPNVNPVVSKVSPTQVNVRLNNILNTIPKAIVPIANQQKGTPQSVFMVKDAKPIITISANQEPVKELKKPELVQYDNKNEKPNDSIKQDSKPKEPQFFIEVDLDDVKYLNTKNKAINKPPDEKKPQDKIKKQGTNTDPDPKKIARSNSESNQEKPITGNPSKTIPIVNQKEAKSMPVNENKNLEIPENRTKMEINIDYKQELGRRANNPDKLNTASEAIDNDVKCTIPITIYNFDDITDSYSNSRDYESKVYPIGTDYSINQQTSNVFIKNQDVEELCERSQDITNPYEIDQPDYYNCEPNYDTNFYQNNFPKYQNVISLYNPKDRIWRNWKTTEIFISKYEPDLKNNEYYDKINGFNMAIMNGDMRYDAYNNMPPYRFYSYPIYKCRYFN